MQTENDYWLAISDSVVKRDFRLLCALSRKFYLFRVSEGSKGRIRSELVGRELSVDERKARLVEIRSKVKSLGLSYRIG